MFRFFRWPKKVDRAIRREQRQIEYELVKLEQLMEGLGQTVKTEQLAFRYLRGHERQKRLSVLNNRTKGLSHWIQGLNVRIGDVSEMIYGKGCRVGYGKDGRYNGCLPGE